MENEEILENEDALEETTVEETAENTVNGYLLIAGVIAGIAAVGFAAYKTYELGKKHGFDKIRNKFAAKADSKSEGVEEEEE